MKKFGLCTFVIALLWGSVSNATLIGTFQPDGSAIQGTAVWNNDTLTVTGSQLGTPAAVAGGFQSDTPEDPIVTVQNSVDNDTEIAWASYHVDLFMNRPFTVSALLACSPSDWTGVIATPSAVWDGSQYKEEIDYSAGTPVPVGGTFDFGYKLNFSGAINYTFSQEMTPSLTPLPEPGTLVLLAGGLLGAMVVRRRIGR